MKLDELQIPLPMSPLMAELYAFKVLNDNDINNISFLIPEDWLARFISTMLQTHPAPKMKNESIAVKNESFSNSIDNSIENQLYNPNIPKEILQLMKEHDCNLIRAAMIFRGLTLKEVSTRYGGASAAANVANIMARSAVDLVAMRRSTLVKLAKALGCPPEWLEVRMGHSAPQEKME